MNDSASKGISANKNAGQLRNAADLEKRKSGIGKRSNYGGGLSSGSSSNPLLTSIAKNNVENNIRTSSKSGSNTEAKRRLKREKQINQAINVPEKVPVLNKYAKAAKLAEKVAKAKQKRAGMFGKLFGGGDKASNAEIEDANAAEQKGEEYKPEDTDGKFVTKLLDRKTKLIFLGVLGGILIINVLVCVLIVSAITGGAQKSYLESHENPTEEELEKAYNKDEEKEREESSNSSSNSSSSSSNSSNSSSSNSSSSSNNSSSSKIIVGDSRSVHLCMYVHSGSWDDCNKVGIKKSDVTYIPGDGKNYSWFSTTALSEIKSQLNTNDNSVVILYIGTNDLSDAVGNAKKYASLYNDLAKDYSNASIVAVSETPIIDANRDTAFESYYSDANIVKFNNELKKQLSSGVNYCDVYSKVKGKVNASDGIHYDEASYKKIYNEIMNCVK